MRKCWMLFPGLVVGLFSCSVLQKMGPAAWSSSDLVIEIAMTGNDGQSEPPTIHTKLPFFVRLVNKGEKPLRVWKEWCSWGYFNLKFEISTRDEEKLVIRKNLRDWFINFPDFWELAPKQALRQEVILGGDEWTGLEDLPPGEHRVRLRAIYGVDQDDDVKEYGVWTGKITSEEHEYVLDIPARTEDPGPKR